MEMIPKILGMISDVIRKGWHHPTHITLLVTSPLRQRCLSHGQPPGVASVVVGRERVVEGG